MYKKLKMGDLTYIDYIRNCEQNLFKPLFESKMVLLTSFILMRIAISYDAVLLFAQF